MSEMISVEVVFAIPERQKLVAVTLQDGACVADAITESGLQADFMDFDFTALPIGIWGRPAERDDAIQNGDRVEIYRALMRDPREARRELARAQRLGSSS